MPDPIPRLHVVTDDAVLAAPGFPERARAVLAAGGASLALHLRGPRTGGRRLHALAEALVPVGEEAGAAVVVNDRVDVALLAGAGGVQLGARSLPVDAARRLLPGGAWIGVSTHGADEARTAEEDGADWAFTGTIHATPSHPGRPGAGTERVARSAEAVDRLPLLAIGGITPERVAPVLEAGAWGVAAIRGVWDAADPAGAVERYLNALEREAR